MMANSSVIRPFIVGTGRAGLAIAKTLAALNIVDPQLNIAPVEWLQRGQPLADAIRATPKNDRAVLILANPPGLHAEMIVAAELAGFRHILSEKPLCVSLAEVAKLREIKAQVGVFHVYRQTWGAQTLKAMITAGELGEVFALEGRYWQSSTAVQALNPRSDNKNWKNNTQLSGEHDVLLDISTHWVDLAIFLAGAKPKAVEVWGSYVNAEAAHRDSHNHIALEFASGARAMTSVSKTVHGATNHFEMTVLGSKASAQWNFLNPDEIVVGEGRTRRILTRSQLDLGSKQSPFHGMGWLEGYIEITRQFFNEMTGAKSSGYPNLKDSLVVLELLLSSARKDKPRQ